jgi:hypothetical protein
VIVLGRHNNGHLSRFAARMYNSTNEEYQFTHTHMCVCARALCIESSKANLSSASSAVLNVGRVAVLEKSRL